MLLFFRSSKIESATVAYVQRLSATFFSNVLESSIEFRRAFPLTRCGTMFNFIFICNVSHMVIYRVTGLALKEISRL